MSVRFGVSDPIRDWEPMPPEEGGAEVSYTPFSAYAVPREAVRKAVTRSATPAPPVLALVPRQPSPQAVRSRGLFSNVLSFPRRDPAPRPNSKPVRVATPLGHRSYSKAVALGMAVAILRQVDEHADASDGPELLEGVQAARWLLSSLERRLEDGP